MTELLLQRLLYMTIVGSVIILVVLLFRLLFRKAPKSMTVFLWLLVFFRLLCPISIKAPISAFQWIPQLIGTEAATMTEEQRYPASETQQAGETGQNLMPVPGEAEQDAAPGNRPHIHFTWTYAEILLLVWGTGAVSILLLLLIQRVLLYKKLKASIPLGGRLYEEEGLNTAFVFGLFQPRIYLPAGLSEQNRQFVVLHEKTHIRYLDPFFKLLGLTVLIVHWFNPLVWLSFFLFSNDLEMACDERVLWHLNDDSRADYAESILALSVRDRSFQGFPVAFSASGPGARIRRILNVQKPSRLLAAAALIVMLLMTGCFVTDPASGKLKEPTFPLSKKELHFGITKEECRNILGEPAKTETVPNEDGSTGWVEIYTYYGLDSVVGKSVSANLYFNDFTDEDYSSSMMEILSTGLSRVMFTAEETSHDKLYKKLNRIYGPLSGGDTSTGQQIGVVDPDLYYEHYVNEKTSLPNLSEEDRSLLLNISPWLRAASDTDSIGLTEVELHGVNGKSAEISVNAGRWVLLQKAKEKAVSSGPPVIREVRSSPVREDQLAKGIELSFEGGNVFGSDPGKQSVRLKNTSDKDCEYGYLFTVEEKRGDRWVVLEPDKEMYFKGIALGLPAHSESVTDYNIGEMFERGLAAGHYRLVIKFGVLTYAAAEFTVKE